MAFHSTPTSSLSHERYNSMSNFTSLLPLKIRETSEFIYAEMKNTFQSAPSYAPWTENNNL